MKHHCDLVRSVSMPALPSSMQVVRAPEPGDADALSFESQPLPKVGDLDVLIRVGAAGLNRLDIFQREGRYPPPRGVTDVLGLEVAGEVVAVGKDVSRWQLGDQVCALLPGGGYAEYARAPADLCLPLPTGMSQIQAAALPEALFTVWSNVFQRVALQPGETLLVQGGASGIGTTAIQLARVFGHRVFATAGTAEKCQACIDLGAERAINYHSEDFVEVVREATQSRGVDVILDMVGGNYLLRELKALADDGRICLSNNAAERALRGIALGRKSWLFAGSDRGGRRAAAMYSLIVTAKMNGNDPQAWLADVLSRLAGHPASRLDELLPWNWQRDRSVISQAA